MNWKGVWLLPSFRRSRLVLCYLISTVFAELLRPNGAELSIRDAADISREEREATHQIRYRMEEETPAGTQLGNLIDDAQLRDHHPPDVLNEFRFRFVADSVPFFEIAPKTGILKTTGEIDRDSPGVCRQKALCEIPLSVVVQPVKYLHIIKVIIEIVDKNDNAPTFKEPSFYIGIIEAALVGSTFVLPTAVDWDSPANGVQHYGLVPASKYFELQVNLKLDGSTEVKLLLQDRLDREQEAEYRLQLLAYDGGSLTGSVDVIISVLDSNDNKPEFTSPVYEVGIMENIPMGTVILQVQAVDKDAGLSGEVWYSFAAQTELMHGHLFGIRNTTGNIYIKGVIDHEKASVYNLIVLAQDRGPDSIGSEATVVIQVEDLNDNSPKITASTLQGVASGTASVSEDAPIGTFVAHVSVNDPDSGPNGRVTCVLNTNTFALVQKYPTEFQIVTAANLDRERVSRHTVGLRCQDTGSTPRTTETSIQVVILDANDNAPMFSAQTYKSSLSENNYIGASVLQVTATDWDDGDNARLVYSIPGNMAITFHIDQRGVITAQDSVDREKYDSFRFPVLAVDQGKPAKTGSALVIITVDDSNDERPVFQQSVYLFNISENEPIGSSVGTVTAIDRDSSLHNAFIYSFSSGQVLTDRFSIDPHSGMIVTRRPLDREQQSVYHLTVMAKDQKLGSMSGTASVTVFVIDKNDNDPVIEFPSATNHTVHVSPWLAAGQTVTRVIAYDLDATSHNNKLSYSIEYIDDGTNVVDDRDYKLFEIDPHFGVITASRSLADFEDFVFTLTVRITDQSHHPSTARQAESLLVIVVNSTFLDHNFTPDVPPPPTARGLKFFSSGLFMYLVAAVGGGCCLVVVTVVFALIVLKRRDRKLWAQKNNSRLETLRTLMTKESVFSTSGDDQSLPSSPIKLPNGNGIHVLTTDIDDIEVRFDRSMLGSNLFLHCFCSICHYFHPGITPE